MKLDIFLCLFIDDIWPAWASSVGDKFTLICGGPLVLSWELLALYFTEVNQYTGFKLQIVYLDSHLVTALNYCSRSGQLFYPGIWWFHENREQLANAWTHTLALMRQWFESSVLVNIVFILSCLFLCVLYNITLTTTFESQVKINKYVGHPENERLNSKTFRIKHSVPILKTTKMEFIPVVTV